MRTLLVIVIGVFVAGFCMPSSAQGGWLACGTPVPTAEQVLAEREQTLRLRARTPRLVLGKGSMTVRVAFHVIRDRQGSAADLSWSHLDAQINALNNAFRDSAFVFCLDRTLTTWTTDHSPGQIWVNMAHNSVGEQQAKATLRRGDATVLNIYTVDPPTATDNDTSTRMCKLDPNFCGTAGGKPAVDLGWGTFPWNYSSAPQLDGIVLNYRTLPGVPNGRNLLHNQGEVGIHEVGHWFGLYHTFQGGCDDGDEVLDTPAELAPVEYEGRERSKQACERGNRDTCPVQPGFDPVHNFMTYSTCLDAFTPAQISRMEEQFQLYRQLGLPCAPCESGGTYDGANCLVATPPAGTTGFVYSGNLYYTPVRENTCPLPGTSFDGANCFVATPPGGTRAFVYRGNLYYTPVSRNSCPIPGSSFDGVNCFVATPPPGTRGFVYSGSLYYTPLVENTCPLEGTSYEGANCFVLTPPSCAKPFVYSGNLFYAPLCHP